MCGSSVPSNSRVGPDCGHLPEEKEQKSNTLPLKDRVEKVFSERGYEINKEGFNGSYENTDREILAIYRAQFHIDKVVVVCSDEEDPLGEEKIVNLDRSIANSKANKGIIVSASGYTSKAKKEADKRGVDLLEVDDLPLESSLLTKIIQKKEGDTELNIYYSVTEECDKNRLFSQTFPDAPGVEAMKKCFAEYSDPLSDDAVMVKIGSGESVVIDLRGVYFIELDKQEEQRIKMDAYRYKGIDLDDDVEFVLKFSVTNITDDKLKDVRLTAELKGSDDHSLGSVDSRVDMGSDFYASKTYMDSSHLFSFGSSVEPSEGDVKEGLRKRFEKKGFQLAEDAEIKKVRGRRWIFEEGEEKYLLKHDESLQVYRALGGRPVKSLRPGSSLDYTVKTVLPLRIFPKHYDDLYMELKLVQAGETLEKRVIDLSSSKNFKRAFREDLKDLKASLESEVKKSEESPHEGRPGCFIATAVYGDPEAEKIDQLRLFRDEILLKKKMGALFTDIYYKISPPLADCISEHKWLRKAVGHTLVYPLVKIAEKALGSD